MSHQTLARPEPTGLTERHAVGTRSRAKPGARLVRGAGRFVDDLDLPGMRHARFVRGPHAHARILSIDTTRAEAMPGVELVWTAADLAPHLARTRFGYDIADEEPLATERVRYVGDEVAVVLARDRNTAVEAAEAVEVEFERLDAVTDARGALSPGAPIVHPELDADPDSPVSGNVLHAFTFETGEVEAAFDRAAVVVEDSFETNRTSPSALEPHGVVADYTPDDGLVIHSPNQKPHAMAASLADLLGLPPAEVVWTVPDVGGSFGTKAELLAHEVCAAALSMATRRPVKLVLDRPEELQSGRGRPAESFDARLAADADGNLLGLEVTMVQNTGAYASYGIHTAETPGLMAACPYLIDHQRITGQVVYTNAVPSGAVRGFGDSQYTFVREALVDRVATELGMDPIECRLRNIARREDMPVTTATGIRWRNVDLPACIEAVRESLDWPADGESSPGRLRGAGVAVSVKRNGKKGEHSDFSKATVEMNRHGDVAVYSDLISVGQGTETGVSQIVADVLGVSPDRVRPVTGDTRTIADGHGVGADRGTVFAGTAAARAAEDLRETIITLGAWFLGIDETDVALGDDRIYDRYDPDTGMGIEEFARRARFDDPTEKPPAFAGGVSLVGHATFETREAETVNPETGLGNVSHTYTHTAVGVVVEIDTGTGEVELLDVAVAEDLGRVINPLLVEGQIQGCIGHAVGDALLEAFTYDVGGTPECGTLVDYHLPTAPDVPLVRKLHEIESPDPATSHGQRGAGEGALLPVPAAVAAAVADATGIRFTELPLSASRVLPALAEAGLVER